MEPVGSSDLSPAATVLWGAIGRKKSVLLFQMSLAANLLVDNILLREQWSGLSNSLVAYGF